LTVHQHPVKVVDEAGKTIDDYVEKTDEVAFTLNHNGGSWEMAKVQGVK
jgi:hypothetical protein